MNKQDLIDQRNKIAARLADYQYNIEVNIEAFEDGDIDLETLGRYNATWHDEAQGAREQLRALNTQLANA